MADALVSIRAVCDTNALVSYHIRNNLYSAAQLELFTPIWSPWIIGELYRVLTWNWAKTRGLSEGERHKCSESSKKMMKLLEPYWTMVSSAVPWPNWDKIKDPWDSVDKSITILEKEYRFLPYAE